MKLFNAFSLNMVDESVYADNAVDISVTTTSTEFVAAYFTESYVEHQSTADVFASQLGKEVKLNRATVSFKESEMFFVGQYIGPRLPEGATVLPDGAKINWLQVYISISPWEE